MSKRIPEASPIILSAPSVIEGNFKTNKSLRIECNYQGAVVSSGKVYLSEQAHFVGRVLDEAARILEFNLVREFSRFLKSFAIQ